MIKRKDRLEKRLFTHQFQFLRSGIGMGKYHALGLCHKNAAQLIQESRCQADLVPQAEKSACGYGLSPRIWSPSNFIRGKKISLYTMFLCLATSTYVSISTSMSLIQFLNDLENEGETVQCLKSLLIDQNTFKVCFKVSGQYHSHENIKKCRRILLCGSRD